MNPEDYLDRTHLPRPAPFLRDRVLRQAEKAWAREDETGRALRWFFHPVTAAASVALALLLALVASDLDQRVTAALVTPGPAGETGSAPSFAASGQEDLPFEEAEERRVFGAFAAYGTGRTLEGFYREEAPSDQGT
jgi:hypothetical protein